MAQKFNTKTQSHKDAKVDSPLSVFAPLCLILRYFKSFGFNSKLQMHPWAFVFNPASPHKREAHMAQKFNTKTQSHKDAKILPSPLCALAPLHPCV